MESLAQQSAAIAHLIADARSGPRIDLSLPAGFRTARLGKFDGRLINISESGFCARVEMPVDIATFLMVALPGFEQLGAMVVWVQYDVIGCHFVDALHPAVVAHLAARTN